MNPNQRLEQLGLALPQVAVPVGAYVPAVRSGNLLFVSGQIALRDGELLHKGKLGSQLSLEEGMSSARQAGLNALAAAAQVAGGLDRIERVVQVRVFVNSAPGFADQPKVANGASELFVQVFGDAGRHARAAIGVSELPLDAAVEVELVAQLAGER